jgi:hypothetical protein
MGQLPKFQWKRKFLFGAKRRKTEFCLGYSSRKTYWEVEKHRIIRRCVIYIYIYTININLFVLEMLCVFTTIRLNMQNLNITIKN